MIEGVSDGGLGVLLLGLAVGVQHAFEADHIAAVSSIAAPQKSVRRIVTHGAVWGLGHTLTLMAVTGGAIAFGLAISQPLTEWLELLVGVMLVGLGANVIVTMARKRIHFHRHNHGDGTTHFHAHSHNGDVAPHDPNRHDHRHPRGLPIRAFVVGMMHGMAGSAALLVLTAATVGSAPLGIGYILLFGLGSIVGMASLSAIIAVPLAWSARAMTWANNGLLGVIGLTTVILGSYIVNDSLRAIISA